jgi:hypothetical protein
MGISPTGGTSFLGQYYSKEQFVDLFPPEYDEEHYVFSQDEGVPEPFQLQDQEYGDRNESTRYRESTDDENSHMRKRPRLSKSSEQII